MAAYSAPNTMGAQKLSKAHARLLSLKKKPFSYNTNGVCCIVLFLMHKEGVCTEFCNLCSRGDIRKFTGEQLPSQPS